MNVLEVLVLVAMIAGLLGVLIPVLPGLLLILGAGLVWAIGDGGGGVRWTVVIVLAALAVMGTAAPFVASGRRSSAAGAPGWVRVAGAVGAVVGFFVIPVVGALAGLPLGIFVAELVRLHSVTAARRSTVEALKGIGIGVSIQFVAGVAMIAVWGIGVVVS